MIEAICRWWRGGDEQLTVACDKSPHWYPGNDHEILFHTVGRKAARRKRWVYDHPCGQARIIPGHCTHKESKCSE